jgi:hypothetical protein
MVDQMPSLINQLVQFEVKIILSYQDAAAKLNGGSAHVPNVFEFQNPPAHQTFVRRNQQTGGCLNRQLMEFLLLYYFCESPAQKIKR